MDQENLSNEEKVSSLNEIINSIGLGSKSVSIIVNPTSDSNDQTINKSNGINEILLTQINSDQNNLTNLSEDVQLLSNDIDRRIGKYLMDEIEKKNTYIIELEELIKFQESEISQLKSKLESVNKLELITKLKSNMETKAESICNKISKLSEQEDSEQSESISSLKSLTTSIKPVQIVQIKKITNESSSGFDSDLNPYSQNQDLILNANSRQKTKSISKDEEPLRYSGIMVLEKPQKQIVIEQYTDVEDTDKSTEIIKQRRRGARL